MISNSMVDELVKRGRDDFANNSDLTDVVVRLSSPKDDRELRTAAVELLRAVLQRKLMEIGDLRKTGFVPWQLPTEDAIARVEREWAALDRQPHIGELLWLRTTGNE